MSEGQDWSQPPFVRKVYHWPFWKTFFVLAPILIITHILSLGIREGFGVSSWLADDWSDILQTSLLLATFFSFLNYQFWSIVLTPTSIGASSGLRTIQFVDIEAVSCPWHGFGFIISVKQKGAWMQLPIPMFMKDMDDFVYHLEQVAPENNPLRQYFHSRAR